MARTDTPNDPFTNERVEIVRQGRHITLAAEPVPMSYDSAIAVLNRKKEEEEQDISVSETIDAFPLDGARAMMLAIEALYGWAEAVATPTFFGPKPPTFIDVPVSYTERTKVIWGSFNLPGLDVRLNTGANWQDGRLVFVISGTVKRKFLSAVTQLAETTREIIKTRSIYKGKAFVLTVDDDGDINWSSPPKFLDLSGVKMDEIVFPDTVQAAINANLWAPIQHSEVCQKIGIPLKRGILLSGPYGCGKTLVSYSTAKIATDNGWTFIMLNRVAGLDKALAFARAYQPAVIFAEDIDRAISGDERTVQIDDILNTIDGVESKGTKILTVLTTNHLENINQAMLRPGRLDAIININPPDAQAAMRLMRMYGRGLLPADADLTEAAAELAGQIPAVIREAVERAKLYRVAEGGTDLSLSGTALVHAAREMKGHMALLAPKADAEPTAGDLLVKGFSALLLGSDKSLDNIDDEITRTRMHAAGARESAERTLSEVKELSEKLDANTENLGYKAIRAKLDEVGTHVVATRKTALEIQRAQKDG